MRSCLVVCVSWCLTAHVFAETWPALPELDGTIEIPAQEWPLKPGPRTVRVTIRYPQGKHAAVNASTGVMLTLHNWGGTDCVGTAAPQTLAARYNVIALCVNYLQSGAEDGVKGPEPYDFGYLQALDALRALWLVEHRLDEAQTPWARGRVFVTGGSGGGNVSLMANKLAPRTFAVVIDLCGMVRLSDDIAFNEPGGSSLNARYVRDPSSPFHLTVDRQALRDTSRLEHLQAWRSHGGTAKLIIVHGEEDATCPYADAVTLAENAKAAGIDVVPRWVKKAELDGKVFTSAGHPLGNRTEIVEAVAGAWLKPDSPTAIVRAGSSDFARQEVITYATPNGRWEIDYTAGYPLGRFVPLK